MRQVNSENFSLKGIFNNLITEGQLIEDVKVVWTDRNYKSHEKLFKNDPNGPPENALVKAKKFKKSLEDKDAKSNDGLYRSIEIQNENFLREGEAKIAKGNKSSKNSFGEDELKTPWATGKKDDCCDEYGISAEEAEKKIKDIKSLDKLDEEYQRLFLQMDNEMDRYWFRRCYQELRNKIGQKEVPKPTLTNKNMVKEGFGSDEIRNAIKKLDREMPKGLDDFRRRVWKYDIKILKSMFDKLKRNTHHGYVKLSDEDAWKKKYLRWYIQLRQTEKNDDSNK